MLRSIVAVVAGFLAIFALSVATDLAFMNLVPGAFGPGGRATSTAVLWVTVAYVAVFAVFGCYLTARLAPNRPMAHALVLGALGLLLNVVGSIARWESAPAWYHIVAILTTMPYAWLGGKLRLAELARRAGGRPEAPAAIAR